MGDTNLQNKQKHLRHFQLCTCIEVGLLFCSNSVMLIKSKIIIFHSPSTSPKTPQTNCYHSSGDQMKIQRSQLCLPKNIGWKLSSRRRKGRGTWDKPPLTKILLRRRKGSSGKRSSEAQTACNEESVYNLILCQPRTFMDISKHTHPFYLFRCVDIL